MMNELTRLATKPLTRRRFLEGMGAAGAVATLASCGDAGKGVGTLFEDTSGRPAVPAIAGVVVAGASPHNCGGKACITKAYVENGVVKRFVTDERPDRNIIDGTGDDPQRRACVRCRAKKGFLYRADRLLKPLKQMGTRGDVNGFVEISWDQAFTEIAASLKDIAARPPWGAKSLYATYASGSSGSYPGTQHGRLLNLLGGSMSHRQDYSWPGYEHVTPFIMGGSTPDGSSRQDCFNAEQIILWSLNHGETIWGGNSMWYTQQAKEKGIPVISIESRVSMTSATVATQSIMLMPGTDAALVLAMMYHLLAEPSVDGTRAAGSFLDPVFIKKYVHGFYDEAAPSLYRTVLPGGSYAVPAGASLSAYVLGNETALVTAGLNAGTSIYPETIGYNYVDPADPLTGKRVPCYGQVPKTPEWAEGITGVPAATIRQLAESIATKKTTCWMGSGLQRHYEQEQGIWLISILQFITGNFGQAGRMFGFHTDRRATSSGSPSGQFSSVSKPASGTPSYGYDTGKLTSAANTWTGTRTTFPVFIWPDIAKNGGTGQSDWNDPQVRAAPPMKAILNFAGNILVNQTGDSNYMKRILSDRSKVEIIVVADHYMTASAAYADYVLPAATSFEKTSYLTGGWNAGELMTFMGKAHEPLGDAKEDFFIIEGIAEKAGVKAKFNDGRDGWTSAQYVKDAFDKGSISTKISWEEWTETGAYVPQAAGATVTISHERYLAAPATNPKTTPSGKVEAFCQAMVEDYCARGYDNIDPAADLVGGGALFHPAAYTASDKSATSTRGRFVYPIPMYIPLYEGLHADGSEPDPLGLEAKGYRCLLNTFHIMYRSHSTHANNAFMTELFKKDARGQPAFLDPRKRTGLATWDDGVYEPIWINPETARQLGVTHGDRVLVSNGRGKLYASAHVTQRARPRVVYLGQGAWHQPNSAGIDVGGCANTLTSARPSRIGCGMTLGNGTLVKIEKA